MQNGHPLAFISRTLSAKNQALSVQEKEIHGSTICSWEMEGRLIWLVGSPQLEVSVRAKYVYTISEQMVTPIIGFRQWNFTQKGKENIADDALSRMQVSELLQITLSQLDIEANRGFSITVSSITTLIRVVHESQHWTQVHMNMRHSLERKGKLVIGAHSHLRDKIMQLLHDNPVVAHSAMDATANVWYSYWRTFCNGCYFQ